MRLHGTSSHADANRLIEWHGSNEKASGHRFLQIMATLSHVKQLRDRLIEQFGCKATAPFSGTVFDLATNKVIYDAEGVPVKERHEGKSATRRAERVYNTLVETATELLAVAKRCAGRSNAELAAFTSRIRELTNKYR